MWRSVGFFMNFTAVIEFATLIAFAVVLLGGRDKREGGWKVISSLLALIAVVQLASMAIVVCVERAPKKHRGLYTDVRKQAFLYDHDSRFFVGWKLDRSWILCTVSWIVLMLDALGIMAAANILVPEDDYEIIPDRR